MKVYTALPDSGTVRKAVLDETGKRSDIHTWNLTERTETPQETLTSDEIRAIEQRDKKPLVPRLRAMVTGTEDQYTQAVSAVMTYCNTLPEHDDKRAWTEGLTLRMIMARNQIAERKYKK